MAMQSIDERGPSITESTIAEFERRIGYRLPQDYRSFMLACNGGSPTPEMVPIDGFPEDDGVAELRTLYSLSHPVNACSLEWHYEECRNYLPEGVIPIGHDSVGDLFCIDVSDVSYGHVYFFDALNKDSAKSRTDLYAVSPSFQAMLRDLRPPISRP